MRVLVVVVLVVLVVILYFPIAFEKYVTTLFFFPGKVKRIWDAMRYIVTHTWDERMSRYILVYVCFVRQYWKQQRSIDWFSMVTFNCEVGNDTVPKKNTKKHYYRCPDAYYTCIDCNKTFDDGVSYKKHTQCISEDEKYQKSLYKGKKNNQNKAAKPEASPKEKKTEEVSPQEKKKTEEAKPESKPKTSKSKSKTPLVKGESLYKILKTIKNKDEKKALLKKLIVKTEKEIELQ